MKTRNKRVTIDLCNEGSGANGKAVIAAAKKHIVKTQPKYDEIRKALCVVKDAFETDVIWAPGASPTYEQVEKVRKVYKAVCDALGKKGVKKGKIVSKS